MYRDSIQKGRTAKSWRRAAKWLLVAFIAGCAGWAMQPTGISETEATFHAQASCGANTSNNPAEISTKSQFVFSWFSPDDRDGAGHVRLGAIDW